MNKGELVSALSAHSGMSKSDSEKFLNSFQEVVTDTLKKNDDISLVGFLSISTAQRKATKGRNPKTGQEIDIPAKTIVKAKAGKKLVDAVN